MNLDTPVYYIGLAHCGKQAVILNQNPDTRLFSLYILKDLKGKISVNVCGVQMFYYRRKREFICPRKRIY